jgi:preprotein translocase subunit SecD
MEKIKKLFTTWKIIVLIFFLLLSLTAISPQLFEDGEIAIRSVGKNSSAELGGIANPGNDVSPVHRERIISVNGNNLQSVEDYFEEISGLEKDRTVTVKTNQNTYSIVTDSSGSLGLKVYEAPSSNLRKGLDLEGGTRVLLKPATAISSEDFDLTIDSLKERLNVYGLSDIVVRKASDLSGEDFILIEIAGVTEDEVQQLIAEQGKFEGKISDSLVFQGGKKDITYVCRTADCSGINPNIGCSPSGDGFLCPFFFSITLSPDAAQKMATATRSLDVLGEYLSEPIVFYLDDVEITSLQIASSLQGRQETQIQISGSEIGRTEQEAVTNTLQEMKRLQTVILTGSLPVKLDVLKLDTISPSLGKEFLDNILLVGALVLLSVITVVFIRYRKLSIVLPMVLTLVSEIVLILGFAAFLKWNMDLAAIAGIIIVVGTGVDHLIIITDETIRGEVSESWKARIKQAMFIVFGAYLTTLSGMLPLYWAGAGLLKGFALTTIAGISFGVLIARPAFAAAIEILLEE